MKPVITTILLIIFTGWYQTYAQCPDVYTDINSNPYVCGYYGDASGNSNWNWELTNINDPNYCAMWYARASSIGNKLTLMGSPFVNASTGKLDIISQERDFTREKGWELLRRDFGCSRVTAYPYFVLYNRYSGLIRLYVYQPETQQQYSTIMVSVKPSKSPYPAVTALADDSLLAPDKYLTANQSQAFGKELIAVGDNGGGARWVFAEINPIFDPNIQHSLYNGTGLEFKMYGVMNTDMKADIKGRSISGQNPALYDFNYTPKNAPTNNNGAETFTAAGEFFLKGSKQISDLTEKIKNTAQVVYDEIGNVPDESVLGILKGMADAFKNDGFQEDMKFLSTFMKRGGHVFKFIGSVIGLFNGGGSLPSASPTYTSYQFVLNGTLTAKNVQQSFVIRVPGTLQPNNDNATYYKCPLGIFNLVNTPEADVVTYRRRSRFDKKSSTPGYETHKSYRIRNNITVAYNAGAGLELVSAQACFIGEILPGPITSASYDPLVPHRITDPYSPSWNHMLPEFESGRIEMIFYDAVNKRHIFQSPWTNIECLNGLAFNVRPLTNVYLQVKALLRKKNDPNDKPIVFSQSYKIDTFTANISTALRNLYASEDGIDMLPPYTNYTRAPSFVSNRNLMNSVLGGGALVEADYSITWSGRSPSYAQGVVVRAGNSVTLKPGFEAQYGTNLLLQINNYGYNLTCGTPSIQAYQHQDNCYNTLTTALRTSSSVSDIPEKEEYNAGSLKVFPSPSNGIVKITGDQLPNATIEVVDHLGRVAYQYINNSDNNQLTLNLQHLPNGIYFLQLKGRNNTVTKKILISQ